ncbi:MAG: hypothetical protein A3E85_03665 [Gammaproteobacteria bacterium RIFCSPHIGHO2_12_FULL_45_12]|nr:MAG: hypothetical protein A3E85_03665 [Gammaproteobacteria bacterium RIFCSPHIGHO2_12_FULL_45_12]
MPAKYTLRDISQLVRLAEDIEKEYPNHNVERKAFFNMFKQVIGSLEVKEEQPEQMELIKKILTGMFLFVMESIASEIKYNLVSPEFQRGYIKNTGSQFYTLVRQGLGLSMGETVSGDMTLICLQKLYQHLRDSYDLHQDPELIKRIRRVIGAVSKKEFAAIEILMRTATSLKVLQKKIPDLQANYIHKTKDRWTKNAGRYQLIRFILFVNRSCECLVDDPLPRNGDNVELTEQERLRQDKCHEEARVLRLGALLVARRMIGEEWQLFNSVLSNELTSLMNPRWAQHVNASTEKDYLQALQCYLETHAVKNVAEKEGYSGDELNQYSERIKGYVVKLTEQEAQPSSTKTAVLWCLKNGFMFAGSQLTSGVGVVAATALAGPVGLTVFLSSRLLMEGLNRMVISQVVPVAEASLTTWVVDKVISSAANATVAVAIKSFSLVQGGLHAFINNAALEKDEKDFIMEYIETWLALDHEFLSLVDKNHIRNLMGMEIPPPALIIAW